MTDWTPDPEKRRIVCAAILIPTNRGDGCIKLVGPRHWDQVMHTQIRNLVEAACPEAKNDFKAYQAYLDTTYDFANQEQGFIDQYGTFFGRDDSFVIATRQGQIRKKSGNPDSTELFSEDLY